MATRKVVKDACIAFLNVAVSDADALAFTVFVYWRWINQAALTGIDLQAEWVAWLNDGKPALDTSPVNGMTWTQIKAL